MAARPVQAAGLVPTVVQHVALLVPRAERDETAALTAAPIPAGVRLADAQPAAQALPQAEQTVQTVLHEARVVTLAQQRVEPADERRVVPIPDGARLADAQSDALPQAERAVLHAARVAVPAEQRAEPVDEQPVAPIPGGARLADAQSDAQALPQAERAALHEARVAALAQQRAELADERRVAALSATPAFSSALRPVAGQPARG